ncbi:MAG: hypothetical protein E6G09_00550 [Actinobacteria bacterium]|nr:MAG: hypothetical protein E6G09_00550 [Actinomycetota bacterium]
MGRRPHRRAGARLRSRRQGTSSARAQDLRRRDLDPTRRPRRILERQRRGGTDAASFVALKGARGYVVFDGSGADESYGPLEVRYAKNADTMLERLAAEHRGTEVVCLVSSDIAVRGTSGQEVQKRSSKTFLGEMEAVSHSEERPHHLRDSLDPETRDKLERMRRGGD